MTTAAQYQVLRVLTDGPKTTRYVAEGIPGGTAGMVRHRFRRLEDRGLVRRLFDGPAVHWEITQAGRAALELTT